MRFLSRSLLILLALYGLVFAVGDLLLARSGAPLWIAVPFAVLFVGLQYLLSPWFVRMFLHIEWDDRGDLLPARNREFVERLCQQRGLKVPRIGVIASGSPNAFAFGHGPWDARVVVTTGLLEVLDPEEANSVLAHEIGHVEHRDFVVMTIAALAPLLLYQLYVFTYRVQQIRLVAYTAYLAYCVSQFLVLALNRTREYSADHYSAEVTGQPDVLASALMKIAYGLVRADGVNQEALAADRKDGRARMAQQVAGAVAVMGISNLRSGAALALGGADPAAAAAVMRWDLVNPWARLYELSSTHPLTALRIRALNQDAAAMHRLARYPLPEDRRVRWGSFPLEFLLWATPWLAAAAGFVVFFHPEWLASLGFVLPPNAKLWLLVAFGAAWIARISYRYRGTFEDADVGTLLADVEVSQMRPRAVRLNGEIVGRGLPGAFWSADLVLRDATGILFLLNRQSIPFARFVFALSEAERYTGHAVEIEGWYRRGLTPYVEISRLRAASGTFRSWSRWIQYALATGLIAAGLVWLLR